MPDYVRILIIFFVTFLQSSIFFTFLYKSLTCRFRLAIALPAFSFVLAAQGTVSLLAEQLSSVRFLTVIAVYIIITLLLFKDSVSKRLFTLLLYFTVLLVADLFSPFIISVLSIPNEFLAQLVANLTYLLVFPLVMSIVYTIVNRLSDIAANKWLLAFSLIPAAQVCTFLFIWNVFSEYGIIVSTNSGFISHCSPVIAVVFIGLGFLFLISDLVFIRVALNSLNSSKEKQRLELLEKESNLNFEYYSELQRDATEMRRFRHDINNILQTIFYLMKNPDERSESELMQTAKALEKEINEISLKRYCSNNLVNCILSTNERKFRQAGISCEFTAALPEETGISPLDLCRVLTNLLDNAFNALDRECEGEKSIKLDLRIVDGYLYINESNTILTADAPKEQASKDHGHGRIIIAGIAEKYGGHFDAKVNDGLFEAFVAMKASEAPAAAAVAQ